MSGNGAPLEPLPLGPDPRPGPLSDEQREELMAMIATQKQQVQRARVAMIVGWAAVGLCLLVGGVAEAALPDSLAVPTAGVLARGLLAIAAVLSVSYYLRVRSLNLGMIDARLASIEAELTRLGAQPHPPEDARPE